MNDCLIEQQVCLAPMPLCHEVAELSDDDVDAEPTKKKRRRGSADADGASAKQKLLSERQARLLVGSPCKACKRKCLGLRTGSSGQRHISLTKISLPFHCAQRSFVFGSERLHSDTNHLAMRECVCFTAV